MAFAKRRLLVVLAHPDDEAFGCGGVLAKYASEGTHVTLVCATRGEVGEISDPSLATTENLGQVREMELKTACEILGVQELHILGYRDSGMAGTPDNEYPNALAKASHNEVVGRVVELVRRVMPQVIVTFDANGGYGHPDHIFMHHVAQEAFDAAGDTSRYAEQLPGNQPYKPQKLYHIAFPRSMIRAFQQGMQEAGIQSDMTDIDPEIMGIPDEEISTVLDVSEFAEKKERAILSHRSQVQNDEFFSWLSRDKRIHFLSQEHMVRAEPPFEVGSDTIENDLFSGIDT